MIRHGILDNSRSRVAGGAFVAATGGTVTTDGDYKIHTFTTSGTFTVTVGGDVSCLLVGGGGSGAGAHTSGIRYGGGGGAGGLKQFNFTASVSDYAIVVGNGGAGGAGYGIDGSPGQNTTGLGQIAYGGGKGGCYENGGDGGSGGGAGSGGTVGGSPTTAGEGHAGGGGDGGDFNRAGAGGGGAGGAGGDYGSSIASVIIPGGIGLEVWGTTYAAGGRGGGQTGSAPEPVNNSGNGGGAMTDANAGIAGSSGVVVIRYKYQ